MIPIHRADGLTLFRELVELNMQFIRPLIYYTSSQDTTDNIVENTEPRTIVHVKRNNTDVEQVKLHYEEQGYHFMLYDRKAGLNLQEVSLHKEILVLTL